MSNEAKERLRAVLPALKVAMEMAAIQEPGGEAGLAVVVTKPDKSGRITATFHGREFLDDLELVLAEAPEGLSASARREAAATVDRIAATLPTPDFMKGSKP